MSERRKITPSDISRMTALDHAGAVLAERLAEELRALGLDDLRAAAEALAQCAEHSARTIDMVSERWRAQKWSAVYGAIVAAETDPIHRGSIASAPPPADAVEFAKTRDEATRRLRQTTTIASRVADAALLADPNTHLTRVAGALGEGVLTYRATCTCGWRGEQRVGADARDRAAADQSGHDDSVKGVS